LGLGAGILNHETALYGNQRDSLGGYYPIGRREVPKFLGTGVLVAAPPKLTIIEVVLINNHKSNSNEILKSNIKIFDI
jgi:hypothetical protein